MRSRWLTALHAPLYERSERYRVLSAFADPDRNVAEEHQQPSISRSPATRTG